MLLHEGETIEYKLQYTPDIKKEVVAFANFSGGSIYIGIQDDGVVVGVDNPDLVMQQLSNAIRDGIRPDITMFTRLETQDIDGKAVVLVTVNTGVKRPYYLTDKGLKPSGVYVRQGVVSAPASEDAIRRMIWQTDGYSFETSRSLTQELTFQAFEIELQKRQMVYEDVKMQTLGILMPEGLYTNLGLLVSDQCIHSIKLAVFQGTDKMVFKDRKEFSGSIFKQLNEAYQTIDFYNATLAHFDGLLRTDVRAYPVEAVREALLNAIVHRDYSFSGSISINLYEDRLEIISLGGIVPGFSLEAALIGASQPRNEKLAALFYRMRLIEAYGTGLSKILNSYNGEVSFNGKPIFENVNGAFRVTLPNIYHCARNDISVIPTVSKISPSALKVLQIISDNEIVSRRDIERALGIGSSRVISLLSELLSAKKIKKIGNGKMTRYIKI